MAAVSDNAEWLVRITPGESIGDVYGFAGAESGEYASAIVYRFDFETGTYLEVSRFNTGNPVAPVEVYAANDGRVVTLDNWHNFGIGNVVSVYDFEGNALLDLKLTDIYTVEELEKFRRSVSSLWWRCGDAKLDEPGNRVVVRDALGRDTAIDLATGEAVTIGESSLCTNDT